MARFQHHKTVYNVSERTVAVDAQRLTDSDSSAGTGSIAVSEEGSNQPEILLQQKLSPLGPGQYLIRRSDGQQSPIAVYRRGEQIQVWYQGEYYELKALARHAGLAEEAAENQISAPLTGKVIAVSVSKGQRVSKGESLVILESMKMETVLSAPADAEVLSVHCAPDEQVSNGQLLIELEFNENE